MSILDQTGRPRTSRKASPLIEVALIEVVDLLLNGRMVGEPGGELVLGDSERFGVGRDDRECM
jgi:hypothetical protein